MKKDKSAQTIPATAGAPATPATVADANVIKAGSPAPPKATKKPAIPMIAGVGKQQKGKKRAANAAGEDKSRVPTRAAQSSKSVARMGRKASGKMSGLDAAAKVLADAGKPLTSQEMVEAMTSKGLWKTSGKTPHATIYSAIIREIAKKGSASRFRKTDRGHFTVAKGAKA